MVKIYLDMSDGYMHFKIEKELAWNTIQSIFKMNHVKFDSSSKTYIEEPSLKAKNLYDELKDYTDIEISEDDLSMLDFATYPPSNEVRRIKYPINKELIEKHPPMKGVEGHENFQLEAIKNVVQKNRVFLNIACRLGKAYISIIGMGTLMKLNKLDCALVIMRSEGLGNYYNEILRFLPFINEEDIVIITKDNRNIEDYFDKKFILISYNTWRLSNEFYKKKNKITSKKPRKPIINFSKWKNNRALVLDECQSVCGDSLQTHYTMIHVDYFEYRYCLSGSIGYNIEKTYNISKILTPQRMIMSKSDWWNYITEEGNSKWNREIIPAKLKEYENEMLKPITVTFSSECLPQTENYEHEIYIEMNDKMRKHYMEICNNALSDIKSKGKITFKTLENKFPILKQCTDDMSLLEISDWNMEKDNPKIEILSSILENKIIDENRNVIIWCNYPRTMKKLTEIFSKYNPICVNGNEKLCGVKREERNQIIERIKTDKDCHLLITNQVLSTSVSFWRFSVNIWYSLPLDCDYLVQANKRIVGLGQKNDIETMYLLFNHSIDNYLYESLKNKLNVKKYFDSGDEEISLDKIKEIINPKKHFTIEGEKLNY